MKSLKATRLALLAMVAACFGYIYASVCAYYGSFLTGAGHGTVFFIALFRTPEPWGLFLWAFSFGIAGLLIKRGAIILAMLIMLPNFISVATILSAPGVVEEVFKVTKALPYRSVSLMIAYLAPLMVMALLAWCNHREGKLQNATTMPLIKSSS